MECSSAEQIATGSIQRVYGQAAHQREYFADFAPLGGNRRDCAVIATVAVEVVVACGLSPLPGDVLEGALAFLCAPPVIAGITRRSEDPENQLSTLSPMPLCVDNVPLACRVRLNRFEEVCCRFFPLLMTGRQKNICYPWEQWCSVQIQLQLSQEVSDIPTGFFHGARNIKVLDMKKATHVRTIAEGFVVRCPSITRVLLPPTLTTVEGWFLFGALNLTEINLHQTEIHSIGPSFMGGCLSLTRLSLPQTLTCIRCGFLCGCRSLLQLDLKHTQIEKISESFLAACKSLTHVVLPATVTELEHGFLKNCSSLQELDLQGCPRLAIIGSNFLQGCESIRYVRIPSDSLTSVDSFGMQNRFDLMESLIQIHCAAPAFQAQLHKHVKNKIEPRLEKRKSRCCIT